MPDWHLLFYSLIVFSLVFMSSQPLAVRLLDQKSKQKNQEKIIHRFRKASAEQSRPLPTRPSGSQPFFRATAHWTFAYSELL
jgi:hypothetical protein